MNRRVAPVKVPVDEQSDLHALALEIEATMHEEMRARNRDNVSVCVSCLGSIGYKDFFFASPSYLGADSPKRRATIFDKASKWPWSMRWFNAVKRIGWRPDRVATGRVHEYPEPYVRIDTDGVIEWGLTKSAKIDLFLWQYDRMVLRVHDHGQIVATTVTDGMTINNRTTMADLHLNDDDYRFEVRVESAREGRKVIDGALHFVGDPDPGMGVPGGGYYVDMAIVDGEWKEIGYQGRDWDGEYGDSGIVHVVTEEAAALKAEAAQAKQERDAAFIREREERKAREAAERRAADERRERERIGRLVARGMASAGLKAKYEAMVAKIEADDAQVDAEMAEATTESVISEAAVHAAYFASRNNANAAALWQSVVDRLNREGGISDDDLAAWLDRAKAGNWRRGLQTLPKAIKVLSESSASDAEPREGAERETVEAKAEDASKPAVSEETRAWLLSCAEKYENDDTTARFWGELVKVLA